MSPTHSVPEGRVEKEKIAVGRRKLLQMLAAGGGVVAAAMIMPDRWVEPVIEFVVLPAHAQTSNPLPAKPKGYTLTADADPLGGDVCWVTSITARMRPAVAGVTIRMTVVGAGAGAPVDAVTDAAGVAVFPDHAAAVSGEFRLLFSFVDPQYGGRTDTLGPYQQGQC